MSRPMMRVEVFADGTTGVKASGAEEEGTVQELQKGFLSFSGI